MKEDEPIMIGLLREIADRLSAIERLLAPPPRTIQVGPDFRITGSAECSSYLADPRY